MMIIWGVTAVAVTLRLALAAPPRWLLAGSYLGMGWMAVGFLPMMLRSMETFSFAMLAAGGLLYTLGAIVYISKRPDPVPHVFGFHEVFHLFVVGAAVCHYLAVYDVVATVSR